MNGFSVTSAELRNAAAVIRGLVDECASQPAVKYRSDPGEFGDSELAVALSEFQQTSWEISTVLLTDSIEMAERLSGTAARYEKTDADIAEFVTEIGKR